MNILIWYGNGQCSTEPIHTDPESLDDLLSAFLENGNELQVIGFTIESAQPTDTQMLDWLGVDRKMVVAAMDRERNEGVLRPVSPGVLKGWKNLRSRMVFEVLRSLYP